MPRVCGFRVLIKPDRVEEVSEGGIVIHASEREKQREQAGIYTGTVIEVGESAWYDYTHKYGERKFAPWANVGDQVLYTKYGGRHVEVPGDDDEDYVIVNDGDVLMVLGENKNE